MNILELQEKRLGLQDELTAIINSGEAEVRELSEDEGCRLAQIRSEIAEIDSEIEKLEKENRTIDNKTIKTNKTMKEVRLFDLIKEVANGNVSEEHRQYVDGNNINFRAAIQATAEGMGEENVPVEKKTLEVEIRNASVLSKMGNTHFGNAVGDIRIPKYLGSNVEWADSENADAADGASGFTEVILQPKRLSGYITISRQFLDQSPEDAEAILIADLAKAVGEKIDETVFGALSGTTARPAGLFAPDAEYLMESGATLTAVTFEDILALEEAVEEKNGTDFMFVADPSVKYALRGTMMAHNLSPIWANGEIDGRKAVVSNSVNKKSILCLDPKDLATAAWGNGLNIIVDPYTLAGKNQIKVTVNYLFDAKLKGERIAGQVFE